MLRTFEAHSTPIYSLQWNSFLPTVFISCAAEWTVKIWDMDTPGPLYTFDLYSPAGDVAWAPYSRWTTLFQIIQKELFSAQPLPP